MKKLLALLLLFSCFSPLKAQYTIPDSAFAAALQQIVPNAMNGNVLVTGHFDVTSRISLNVDNSGISDLDGVQFFVSLQFLGCDHNLLTDLPSLPNSLLTLHCNYNQLTSLPTLPNSLTHLFCYNNLLTSLPSLPNSLVNLGCQFNQLTALPTLPNPMTYLRCESNQLSTLPALPNSISMMWCGQNQLTYIPTLPDSLYWLYCSENQLNCLPILPNTLNRLHCQDNFIQCLPNYPPNLPPFGTTVLESNLGFTPIYCSPTSTCFPREAIAGKCFNDANGNGQLDSGEQPFPNGVAEAQPGNYVSGADQNGNYILAVDTGTYTVQGQAVIYHDITTPSYYDTISPGMVVLYDIGYQSISGIYDLVVDIQAAPARPGFDNNVYLQVQNIGTEATTAAINFDLDLDQTWVNSSIIPDAQSGNNATWSTPMNPGDTWNTTVTLYTSTGVALGTPINHLLNATPTQSDTTPGNNTDIWFGHVVGSYDPNTKSASPSSITPIEVQNGEHIEYTIQFQNTGSFMAETVKITDTLSNDLQWNTIEMISNSHENFWSLSNGVLEIIHNAINLPDSTSDEPNSYGFVKFRIKPVNTLIVGDEVENTANIYFDFNEPVITDPEIFEVSIPTAISEIKNAGFEMYPNPTNGNVTIMAIEPIERIDVVQLDGRVFQGISANAKRVGLDLNDLAKGVYVVQVSFTNEHSSSQLLIVE